MYVASDILYHNAEACVDFSRRLSRNGLLLGGFFPLSVVSLSPYVVVFAFLIYAFRLLVSCPFNIVLC